MNRLLGLAASRPQLLADHAQAYAEMAAVQIERLMADWTQRALLGALAIGAALVAAMLAGVAILWWSAATVSQTPASWVLLATPSVPALIAACCAVALRVRRPNGALDAVRQQLQADLLVWRAGGSSA